MSLWTKALSSPPVVWVAAGVDRRTAAAIQALQADDSGQIVISEHPSAAAHWLNRSGVPCIRAPLGSPPKDSLIQEVMKLAVGRRPVLAHAVGLDGLRLAARMAARTRIPVIAEVDCKPGFGWRQYLGRMILFGPELAAIRVRTSADMRRIENEGWPLAQLRGRLHWIRRGVRMTWYPAHPAGMAPAGHKTVARIGVALDSVAQRHIGLVLQTLSWLPADSAVRLLLFGSRTACLRAGELLKALSDGESTRVDVVIDTGDPSRLWGDCIMSIHDPAAPGSAERLVDAMASAATPIVLTQERAHPVTDGHTGLVLPPDNPFALSQAIQHLLAHPERRHALAVDARQLIARDYRLSDTVEKLESLHASIAGKTESCDV